LPAGGAEGAIPNRLPLVSRLPEVQRTRLETSPILVVEKKPCKSLQFRSAFGFSNMTEISWRLTMLESKIVQFVGRVKGVPLTPDVTPMGLNGICNEKMHEHKKFIESLNGEKVEKVKQLRKRGSMAGMTHGASCLQRAYLADIRCSTAKE
jgi:hypothetical protein